MMFYHYIKDRYSYYDVNNVKIKNLDSHWSFILSRVIYLMVA